MSIALGFEMIGQTNYLRLRRGDCEARYGAWTLTTLWGGDANLSGLFIVGNGTDRHWTWAEVRGRLAFWRR